MNHTISQPPEGRPPLTAEQVMIALSNYEGIEADSISYLGARIGALEEALISRRARRRLRRAYRQTDKAYRWAGESFRERRFEATSADESLFGFMGGPAIGGPAAERDYFPYGKPPGRHGGDR
jgi:hypothetical protein